MSPDDRVRRKLAEVLGECWLAAVLASAVTESARILSAHSVFVVLCLDCMAKGRYGDIEEMADPARTRVPVIVVSRTAEPVPAGASDYLAYPQIAGDLQRIIRSALYCTRGNGTSKPLESL